MADDGTVSITITGAVDSSLTASTSAARASLADLAASGNAAASTLNGGLSDGFKNAAAAATRMAADVANLGQKLGFEIAVSAARDAAREIIANDRLSQQQKIDSADAAWAQKLAGEKLNAQQLAAVAKEQAAEETEIRRQAVREQEEIDRGHLNTKLALSRIAIENEKTNLQLGVGYQSLTEAQKLEMLKAFDDREIQLEIDAEKQKQQGYATTTSVYQAAQDKIALLTAQRVQKDDQYAVQEANAQIATWRTSDQEIESAESELVSDIFSKRQRLVADLRQVGLRMLSDEVTNDLKMLSEHEMVNLGMLASDKATAQEGMLFKLGQYVLDKTGLVTNETAKATAVTTGQLEQNSALASGAAAGKAVSLASAESQIATDAAVGGAGAAAATAMIPYVGPLLAPAAGAATYAEIMAYAGLASAEGGQYSVPFDGQLTELHRNEMVLPASIAGAMRETFEGRGRAAPQFGGGATSLNVTHNIQSIDTGGIERVMRNNMAQIARVARNYQRNQVRR